LTVSVLARPGTPSRSVAAGQQGHEHALEHGFLPHDDALDLEQRLLQRMVCRPGGAHVVLPLECPQAALVGCHAIVSVLIRGC
jgi:hypothetical protein